MLTAEAKKLKVGRRVIIWWGTPSACTGTVIETGYNAVKIEWDDGQVGIIHHNDHHNVERYSSTQSIVPDAEKAG